MSAAEVTFGAADLTNCDREPIHAPGSIQPYGVLLVLDRRNLVVEQLAGDTRFLLGLDPARLFGVAVSRILDPEAVVYLNAQCASAAEFVAPSIQLGVRAQSGSLLLDMTVHALGATVIVELEPARRTHTLAADPFAHLKTLLAHVRNATDLPDLCQVAATDLRALSGFGRAMVYRFLEDGTGTVIAESLAAGVESFLGLHYPASDIPRQARELYRRNWLRGTPDIDCVAMPVRPEVNPRTGQPIDMSHCTLRTMSPIHGEYLRNMGVCASLSISIVLEDRLWGLCVLHDFAPHHVPADLRVALEIFAQVFSLLIEAKIQADHARRRTQARGIRDVLVARLVEGSEPGSALASQELLDSVAASGAALIFEGKITTVGRTPDTREIEALAHWLSGDKASVRATDCLSQRYAAAAGFCDIASGLLAISLSKEPRDYVLWFRPEYVRTVRWGGDPVKPVQLGPLGARLTPRASFAEWREERRNHAEPWTAVDLESAQELRVALLEAGLRASAAQIHTVFEAMTEGLVLQAPGGAILNANPAASTILGLSRDQLLGKTSMDPDWQAIREDGTPFPGAEHPAMVALRTGQPSRDQVMGVKDPKTGLRWISINAQPMFSYDPSRPGAVVSTFVDITATRQLTEDLRLARMDLQAILDNVPARITWWQADYTNRYANRVAEAQFGLAANAAVGRHVREVIGAQRYEQAEPFFEAALAGERQTHEQTESQPDGSIRYSQVTFVPMRQEGRVVGLCALATDITEQREAHTRIRELAQRLEAVRENERRSISQQLHEGLAQNLFAIKLGIANLQALARAEPAIVAECGVLADIVEKCMSDTRQIANDLLPTALFHLALSASLEELARWFGPRAGLVIDVVEVAPFPELDETVKLVLFRAAQEALSNVARHARAARVSITLRSDPQHLWMDVIDDGVGIGQADLTKPQSLGLLGIRERLLSLGGNLSARENAAAGTTLSISLPRPDAKKSSRRSRRSTGA